MHPNYESDIQNREIARAEQDKRASIIGIFKLIWVAISIYTFYNVWSNQFPAKLVILLCVEVVIFILVCFWHQQVRNRVAYEVGLIDIAHQNLSRRSGEWNTFPDIGEEFLDSNHDYAIDLDIVGNNSLFQFLNSTNTYYGRERLAGDLLSPDYSPAKISVRQSAIAELSDNYVWTSHIEYRFSQIGIDSSFPKLISELQSKEHFIKSSFLRLLLNISRITTCASLLFTIITKNPIGSAISAILVMFQLVLWGLGLLKTNSYLGIMRKLPYKLERYNAVIKEIAQHDFTATKLKEIKSTLQSAQDAIRDLAKISNNISQSQNGIACIVLNALWIWDYKNAVDLDIWKQKHGPFAKMWFTTLGEFESLLSFSNLPRNCTVTCAPTISTQPNIIQTKDTGHPLLNNQDRVYNDLELDNNIFIISGSNMSGKTTFMRTIGINIVLANAGSYVCAKQMNCSPMRIMTSMRIADELTEGISTFYAELKRIKKIIDALPSNRSRLFLIDEIFRGTNSLDRQKGAEGVLKKLYELDMCGFITTHDLELCKLENAYPRIVNYCFYEHYQSGEIHFDYRMKKGISKTTNAEYLLRKVGII